MDQAKYDRYNNMVERYLQDERYTEALKYLDKLFDVAKDDLDLLRGPYWSCKEICYVMLNDFESAFKAVECGITIDPEYYKDKASNCFDEEEFNVALIYLERLLGEDGVYYNDDFLWWMRGICYQKVGHIQDALNCFDRCVYINPKNPYHWICKGDILLNIGNFKESIICFDKASDLDPTEALALNFKGIALNSMEKYKEAIECFDFALELEPTNHVFKNNRILAQNSLENEDKGLVDFDKDNYICSKCGFENLKEATFCSGCGLSLKVENNVNCDNCGVENIENAIFCSGCGQKLEKNRNKEEIDDSAINNISKKESEMIDINNDSEDKIASIPNIGIVLAKKAIQIRDSHGGFESVEDFCVKMELKPHIVKKVEHIIICGPLNKPKKSDHSGRIVDF